MQYSKIFSAVAIFVAAVAAAPACAPATPGAPGIPGVPTLPGTPSHPTTGTDGVPANHNNGDAVTGSCVSNSDFAYTWCCIGNANCSPLLSLVGGIPVCPSIGTVVNNSHCCSNKNEQDVEQNGAQNGGLVNVQNVNIGLDALNCIL